MEGLTGCAMACGKRDIGDGLQLQGPFGLLKLGLNVLNVPGMFTDESFKLSTFWVFE